MQKNESTLDRIVRAILVFVLFSLGVVVFTGTMSIVAFIVGVILALTAITGFCPLYKIFGISTLKGE